MFIYLVALAAIIFLIFGLLHVKCFSNDWLRSSWMRSSSTLYNGLTCRPIVGDSLDNEDAEGRLSDRPIMLISDGVRAEDLPITKPAISNSSRLSEVLLEEGVNKLRSPNPPRFSLEDILSDGRDRDLGLTAANNLQLGTSQRDTYRTSKQEAKENIFQTLKNSIEKTSPYSSSRLNTRQIYNLLLKETLKEHEAKQKLVDNAMGNFSEATPADTMDELPSSSENNAEREDSSDK